MDASLYPRRIGRKGDLQCRSHRPGDPGRRAYPVRRNRTNPLLQILARQCRARGLVRGRAFYPRKAFARQRVPPAWDLRLEHHAVLPAALDGAERAVRNRKTELNVCSTRPPRRENALSGRSPLPNPAPRPNCPLPTPCRCGIMSAGKPRIAAIHLWNHHERLFHRALSTPPFLSLRYCVRQPVLSSRCAVMQADGQAQNHPPA